MAEIGIESGIRGGSRTIQSGLVFLTRTLGLFLRGRAPTHRDIANALRDAFAELGATYIKLGQFIASAPSFFPEEYVEAMQDCLDSVRPVPFEEIRTQIERELGGKIDSHYSYFEEEPIASASIAQVHAARTREGIDVVVKVQRPDIESTLRTDMQILGLVIRILGWIAPPFQKSGIIGMVEEFQNSILEEVDFVQESKNIETFDSHLRSIGEDRARVPKVYYELSTKRILTMERFYGVPITDMQGLRAYTKDPRKVLNTALEIWFSSLGKSGFFHADVHAGNLMILKDGTIGFIDFGIVGRISPKIWKGLLLFTQGIGMGEARYVAEGLIEMNSTTTSITIIELSNRLKSVFDELEKVYESLSLGQVEQFDEKKMNQLLFQMKEIAEAAGLRVPREFALLMKQMLYFDRYTKSMAPEVNLFRDGQKYIK